MTLCQFRLGPAEGMLMHIAQMERTLIRERQAAGIRAAMAAGKRWGGRRPGILKADPARARVLREPGLTPREIGTAPNVSARTVARILRRPTVAR